MFLGGIPIIKSRHAEVAPTFALAGYGGQARLNGRPNKDQRHDINKTQLAEVAQW